MSSEISAAAAFLWRITGVSFAFQNVGTSLTCSLDSRCSCRPVILIHALWSNIQRSAGLLDRVTKMLESVRNVFKFLWLGLFSTQTETTSLYLRWSRRWTDQNIQTLVFLFG